MDVELQGFFAGLGGAAAVQSLALLMARRWLGRIDVMETDLKDLRTKEMRDIEDDMSKASMSRRGIHQKLTQIEKQMVTRGELEERDRNYIAHVRSLAELTTRIEDVHTHQEQMMLEIKALTSDLHRLQGKVN